MNCPICKIGEIETEWDDPEQYDPEWSCLNENCPSQGWGIYCYISIVLKDDDKAIRFSEKWRNEYFKEVQRHE